MRIDTAFWVALACVTLLSMSASAEPDCWATGTASYSADPGYEGYWKYCYDISWSGLPYGTSHVDVFLMFTDCACLCKPGYFAFLDTVGTGPGDSGGESCTVYYYGSFLCDGDPTMGNGLPTIKFEYFEDSCEPGTDGYAHVCFYSVAAPIPDSHYEDAIGIKYGQLTDTGCLDGVMPSCDTDASDTDKTTWGNVKALYN